MCSDKDKSQIANEVKRLFGIINDRSLKRNTEDNQVAKSNKRRVSN